MCPSVEEAWVSPRVALYLQGFLCIQQQIEAVFDPAAGDVGPLLPQLVPAVLLPLTCHTARDTAGQRSAYTQLLWGWIWEFYSNSIFVWHLKNNQDPK